MPSTDKPTREILRPVLAWMATWLHQGHVELGALDAGGAREDADAFGRMLRWRQAAASVRELRRVVAQIERRPSRATRQVREETLALGRGRLDVTLYVRGRSAYRAPPRRFPIIRQDATLETPENVLVAEVLREAAREVGCYEGPRGSAEAHLASELGLWLRATLHQPPWNAVQRRERIVALALQVERRVRKRQTGNDRAYGALLEWLRAWQADPTKLDPAAVEARVDAALAFPTGEWFWERVFEVYCLQQLAAAFEAGGWRREGALRPLYERHHAPVAVYRRADRRVEIWFQAALPSEDAAWRYEGGSPLRGIPDFVLRDGRPGPMLVDAKYRRADGLQRSGEIYKHLGYLANHPALYAAAPFVGGLLFLGSSLQRQALRDAEGGRLELLALDVAPEAAAARAEALYAMLVPWIERA